MITNLPSEVAALFLVFAPLFSKRVWKSVEVLLIGSILAPGKRTISSILRVMGLGQEQHFQNYHRVLSRACWSSRAVSRRLLLLLASVFVPIGPVIFGIDDTIERRKGAKIKARGIYRDPVRSSHSQCVKTSGLRWLSVMLLAEIPWAQRVWALPFWTVLAPSQHYSEANCNTHKSLTDWGRQMLLQIRRWLPNRELVVVGDSSFAVLDLLHALLSSAQELLYDYTLTFGCRLI
jgi:DDE superfamily endonuclease